VNEAKWLACTDSAPMLRFLRGKVSERKSLLLGVACCRRAASDLPVDEYQRLVAVWERRADGAVVQGELAAARDACCRAFEDYRQQQPLAALIGRPLLHLLQAVNWLLQKNPVVGERVGLSAAAESRVLLVPSVTSSGAEFAYQARLVRCIFGNPFGPSPPLPAAVLAWSDRTVPRLAQAAYDYRRLPESTLDPARLGILADALLDAGCGDEELLAHLRSAGPHVRGCFAIDVILGKS
jgi:hypothetical protein